MVTAVSSLPLSCQFRSKTIGEIRIIRQPQGLGKAHPALHMALQRGKR